ASFFGWGAGGAGNIKYILEIMDMLGYKKILAILDGNKKEEVESLSKKFPSYRFLCIPADDVRTKPAQKCKSEVFGLLDENYLLRDCYRRQMQSLGAELVQYFNNA
ncbi:MAG: hypothetical protein ACKODO_06315, partial [Rhabdaerophilum sp.]